MTIGRMKKLNEELGTAAINATPYDKDVDDEYECSLRNCTVNVRYYIQQAIEEMERLGLKKI